MASRLRSFVGAAVIGAALVASASPALADDHLANAATSSGADDRGFANPVAANPSGVSGPAAQPGTVPGLGDPSGGQDTGTPAFDPVSLCERLDAGSAGVGPGC